MSAGVAASLRELIELRRRVPPAGLRQARTSLAAAPGSHLSRHLSRGMEFAEARPYQAGDDFRSVDWRQTARRGRLYTKLFHEEHERPVCLFADLGPSMRFGTRVAFKSVAAARAAAWLAWMTVAAGDRVGGLVWNGGREWEVRPRGRDQGALDLLRCLAAASAPPAPDGNFAQPLQTLARMGRPGSLVVLISDFAGLDADGERRILALAKGGELRLIHVYDRLEADAPPPGRYAVTDGLRRLQLDLHPATARNAYGAAFAAHRAALERLAQRAGTALLSLATDADPATVLPAAFSS